jgi:hypothetical protein
MAALEDSYKNWAPEFQKQPVKKTEVRLRAEQNAAGILQIIRVVEPRHDIALHKWLATIPLGGRLAVKAPAPVVEPVAQLKGIVLKSATPAPVVTTVVKVEPLPKGATEATPAQARAVVEMLATRDWRQPSFQERVESLIQKEIKNQKPDDGIRRLNGGSILVAGTPPPASGSGPLFSSPGAAPSRTPATPSNDPAPTISWTRPDDIHRGQATLSGSIRIAKGLAITGPNEHIVIFRELEGLAIEKAQVWMNDGRFEIATRSVRGRLVGQLRDSKGAVLGQGEIKLANLTPKSDSMRIENLNMVITPAIDGARIEVVSAHSYGNHVETVPAAKVWLVGASSPLKGDQDRRYFIENGLQPGSSFVAQATAENHWGTMVVGVTRQETRAQLFPNKLMDALLNLTIGADRSLADKSGVIWGRITKNGQPLIGARVEMAGDHRREPVYFSSLLLPDRYSDTTGENGAFAFVWVTPGIQSVRVVYQGKSFPAQVIPVEVGHVSYLEFDLGEPDMVPLEIFDPIDGSLEVNAILRLAGDETNEIEVQGRGRLSLPAGNGLIMLDGDAGEQYEVMRYSTSRNAKFLRLPVVRRDWLMSLASRRRVNLDSGVGLVVGFAMEDDFVVSVQGADNEGESMPVIVYFDPRGQAIFGDEGVAGGGFAIFNVPAGLRTVNVSTKNSRRLFSQVLVAAPEVVNAVVK